MRYAYILVALVGLGAAAVGVLAGGPNAPLPAPPAQDALPRVETLVTVSRQGILVRVDLAPPGAGLPETLVWSDASHGTRVYRLER